MANGDTAINQEIDERALSRASYTRHRDHQITCTITGSTVSIPIHVSSDIGISDLGADGIEAFAGFEGELSISRGVTSHSAFWSLKQTSYIVSRAAVLAHAGRRYGMKFERFQR